MRYVFPKLPASDTEIAVGDLVTEINNQTTAAISMDKMLDIANTPGTIKLCIERKSQCFNLDITHIEGTQILPFNEYKHCFMREHADDKNLA